MKLHPHSTKDGRSLWRATLNGKHNDGDGGIDISQTWFIIAKNGREARKTLEPLVKAASARYQWYRSPTISYRAVSPGELVVSYRGPGGRLREVELSDKSAEGLDLTVALLDSR